MKMRGVLLYNLPKEKLKKIRVILFKLGLEARVVHSQEYGLPVGTLAGTEEMAPADLPRESGEEAFSDEMLVMCSLPSPLFSAFLGALRQNRCPVALKAVLTETNASWSSLRLHGELLAEHEALQRAKGAAGPGVHR